MTLSILNYLTSIDNNSKFLLTIIIIIIVLLILIFIFNYLSNKQVRRQRKLVREINKDAKHIEPIKVKKEEKKKEISKKIEISDNNKKNEIEEKLIISEPTVVNKNISVVQDDIETIDDEEIIEVLQDDNESDIDRILREIKQASKEDSINLTEFEKEQEETAIISYDELCKRAGVKKKVYKANKEEAKVPTEATVNDNKKYKPTKFVSPIYGIEEAKGENIDLDQTFLQNLKDFRSTLDL